MYNFPCNCNVLAPTSLEVCYAIPPTHFKDIPTFNFILDPDTCSSKAHQKKTSLRLQQKNEAREIRKRKHWVKDGCSEKCTRKCNFKLDREARIRLNAAYWNMSWAEQRAYVRESYTVVVPKRKLISPKRNPRRIFLLENSDHIKVEVCKVFFLTTLGYRQTNDCILYGANDLIDKRGKHMKTPKKDRNIITQHIKSFNVLAPNSTSRNARQRSLPCDLSVSKMHKHYCNMHPDKPVSYELYRQHLQTYMTSRQ